MARPHIPNMNDIKSLANEEIRFYALSGAVMSLGAGLELAYFDLFERATKINQDIGASFFYLILNASLRRDMAYAAVSGTIAGTPLAAEWKTISERISKLTGQNSQRNLLAHAVIRQDVLVKQGPVAPNGFLGLTETTINYHVEQDAALLLAGKQKATAADFKSLFIYCEDIIAVWAILTHFLASFPDPSSNLFCKNVTYHIT